MSLSLSNYNSPAVQIRTALKARVEALLPLTPSSPETDRYEIGEYYGPYDFEQKKMLKNLCKRSPQIQFSFENFIVIDEGSNDRQDSLRVSYYVYASSLRNSTEASDTAISIAEILSEILHNFRVNVILENSDSFNTTVYFVSCQPVNKEDDLSGWIVSFVVKLNRMMNYG